MPDLDISICGVAKLLSNLISTKATGPDAIRSTVLKEISRVIAPAVTAISQKSLDTCTVFRDLVDNLAFWLGNVSGSGTGSLDS